MLIFWSPRCHILAELSAELLVLDKLFIDDQNSFELLGVFLRDLIARGWTDVSINIQWQVILIQHLIFNLLVDFILLLNEVLIHLQPWNLYFFKLIDAFHLILLWRWRLFFLFFFLLWELGWLVFPDCPPYRKSKPVKERCLLRVVNSPPQTLPPPWCVLCGSAARSMEHRSMRDHIPSKADR